MELTLSPGSSLNSRPFWTSNAELFISRRCLLTAKRLTIELADVVTPECLRRIALEVLKLDKVDWQHINALAITGPSSAFTYYIDTVVVDDQTSADIAHTLQYFKRNLRNIVDLNLAYSNVGSMGSYICSCFGAIYGGQLQAHRASLTVPFTFVEFSRNLKVLELTLDSSAARILPSVCGETLVVLKLERVPLNLAWHYFCYDVFARSIVFRRLAILHLGYEASGMEITKEEIQSKSISGAHYYDQLCFPALRQLSITNCTPDCDLLYADIPFPELKVVRLSGHFDNIRHCSRLKLSWVGDLSIEIHSSEPDETADVYKVTNHFFSGVCIGRTASLDFNTERFPLDPELIRWANLTRLAVVVVDYVTVCKLIALLPSLAELSVFTLKLGVSLGGELDMAESLYSSADPLLAWGERLATIRILEFSEHCPSAVAVGSVQDLILHATSLAYLYVPEPLGPYLIEFVDKKKSRHAHLGKISIF
ncbi:hypothetical protein IW152_002873 [Coemansia sp. BCRC 34962]|nr:hypothetical protein IW152_002873 [Coemansia sp. BCRC 34962]